MFILVKYKKRHLYQLKIIYDIEQFPNFHSFCGIDIDTGKKYTYVIHNSRNDIVEYLNFLKDVNTLIGFNNINYDYPMIHYLMNLEILFKNFSADKINKFLYKESSRLINSEFTEIKNPKIKQIDLFRIHHYNNKAKITSLKWIGIYLKFKKIQDLPFKPNTLIESSDVGKIIDYNFNDVFITYEFFKYSEKDIQLRNILSEKFNLDLTNSDSPNIGTEIFASYLSKYLKIDLNSLKKLRTYRESIDLNECILNNISFESEEFSSLLNYLKNQVIDKTKGFFVNLPLLKVKSILPYVDPLSINSKKELLKNLNIKYKGITYVYGLGGIHASIEPGIYTSDDEYMILDIDVTSYYPFLSIKNKFYPEHLTEIFCEVYEFIFNERAKYPKKTPENEGLKLALNGSFGKSNSEYSYFFDSKFTMQITINGQLLLTRLIEKLSLNIPDLFVLQANTDGITVKFKRCYYNIVKYYCKEWEKLTGLVLEEEEYSKMFILNVNNYIGVYKNSKKEPKFKGDSFLTEREPHKNHSAKIIQIAVKEYLLNGISLEDTIKNHKDIFDFCYCFKSNKGWEVRYDYEGKTEILQKTNRYFVSNNGGEIYKYNISDGRKIFLNAKRKTTIFNNFFESNYDIDYEHYIQNSKKIIQEIIKFKN